MLRKKSKVTMADEALPALASSSDLTSDFSPLFPLLHWHRLLTISPLCWACSQLRALELAGMFFPQKLSHVTPLSSTHVSFPTSPPHFLTVLSKESLPSFCPLLLLYFVHNTHHFLLFLFIFVCFLSSPFECMFCEGKNLTLFVHRCILSTQNNSWQVVVIP